MKIINNWIEKKLHPQMHIFPICAEMGPQLAKGLFSTHQSQMFWMNEGLIISQLGKTVALLKDVKSYVTIFHGVYCENRIMRYSLIQGKK